MKILAIETSCDETGIAIVEAKGGLKSPSFQILSNVVASQIKVHAPFGGIVPNLAKREHEKNLMPVLLRALREARKDLRSIDVIAVTVGPGLAPALWTGVNFAKELARTEKKPLIPVNHMEGHIVSVLLDASNIQCFTSTLNVGRLISKQIKKPKIVFPALALLVSGGHTELVLLKNWRNKKIIGETLDDAAGEAFDKVARMLELGYPGGPAIAKEAEKKLRVTPYALRVTLPRPMLHTKDYNFSFSGLKTAVLYLAEKLKKDGISIKEMRPAIAREFQNAVVEALTAKTIRAAKEHRAKTIILGGGVAANNLLRETLAKEIKKQIPASGLRLPAIQFTGDNAAMIAAAAYLFPRKVSWTKLKAIDRMRI